MMQASHAKKTRLQSPLYYRLLLLFLLGAISSCNHQQSDEQGRQASPTESSSANNDLYHLGFQSKWLQANGIRMHYLEAGRGETVIFLHGFPYFSGSWYRLMEPISQCQRVISPDNRGFGFSDKPSDAAHYRLPVLTEDVRQLVLSLKLNSPPVIVGHDWGGALAWAFAQSYPDLVKKLVVINAPPFNVLLDSLKQHATQREASKYVGLIKSRLSEWYFWFRGPDILWSEKLEEARRAGDLSDAFKDAYMLAWSTPGAANGAANWYRANIPEFDAITEQDYLPEYGDSIDVPSLLIWSERDPAFVAETLQTTKDSIRHLNVITLDTDSHAPFIDEPQNVYPVISEFLGLNDCPT